MMTAQQATSIVKKITLERQRKYEQDRKAALEEEKRVIETVWKMHGKDLIKQIDGFIEKSALQGRTYTYEPSRSNPNGDEVIYLDDIHLPIKNKLMVHYINKGFFVVDYAYGGIKITWEG